MKTQQNRERKWRKKISQLKKRKREKIQFFSFSMPKIDSEKVSLGGEKNRKSNNRQGMKFKP